MRFLCVVVMLLCLTAAASLTAQKGKVPVSYRFSMRETIAPVQVSTKVAYRERLVPSHRPLVQHLVMHVTAYCPCSICCEKSPHDKSYGVTATGKNAFVPNGVAADFGLLPIRTKVSIPGVGLKVVDDTGKDMRLAAKKGIYHIDIRMRRHSDAVRFGSRWLRVAVIR